MASVPAKEQPFPLLALPTELRLMIYEAIEFPDTRHTLDREESQLPRQRWPRPPIPQVQASSSVVLIRRHTPKEITTACHILQTCRQVYEEAYPILTRKAEHLRAQPVRFLVDYGAAWALLNTFNVFWSFSGLEYREIKNEECQAVKQFRQMCSDALEPRGQRHDDTEGIRTAWSEVRRHRKYSRTTEITITHDDGITYGHEVWRTLARVCELAGHLNRKESSPPRRARVAVVYKSPLRISCEGPIPSGDLEERFLLGKEPRYASWDRPIGGVFVRPLNEEAFKEHMESLKRC